MKKVSILALCALIITSCNISDVSFGAKGSLVLSFESVESSVETKATKPGVDDYNENVFGTIYYAIFPSGSTSSAPVISGEAEPRNGSAVVDVEIKGSEFTALFGSSNSAVVYAISNYPGGNSTLSGKSLTQLKALALESDFKTTQSSFVMSGEGTVTVPTGTYKASGTVGLSRVASKISVLTKVESIGDESAWHGWTPDPENLMFKFCYGYKKALMSGEPDAYSAEGALFSYDYVTPQRMTDGSSTYYVPNPFYSYPREWTLDAESMPYLMVRLPLNKYDGASITESAFCYYKIFFTGNQFTRNTWYEFNLTLKMLGNFSEDDPLVTTTDTYILVADWSNSSSGSGFNTSSLVLDLRYLEVSDKTVEIYGDQSYTILLSSSHNCKVVSGKCTYPDYSSITVSTVTRNGVASGTGNSISNIGKKKGTATMAVSQSSLVFTHNLVNYGEGTNYDVVPYSFEFTIQHADAPQYTQTVTIIQYPSMYITADGGERGTSSGYGNAYVNNTQSANDNYGGPADISGAGNKNPNMYVVTTTKLPSGSSFILADPRSVQVNNLTNWNPALRSAPSVEGGNRVLTYYHPTASSTASDSKVIAPAFRIASSFGASQTMSFSNGQKRCASYQENGRPAGRWRLPTAAEIQFMCQLTTDKCIPRLLGNDSDDHTDYWSGYGYVRVYGGTSTRTPEINTGDYSGRTDKSCNVRCVYDEWFWTQSNYPTVNKTTFTWGDMNVSL
jgi:hypothetical protein